VNTRPIGRSRRAPQEHRSEQSLAGIPLIHVARGGWGADGQYHFGQARGLIAIGDVAVGLVAIGGVAIGIFALGGVAVGLVAFAGVAMGIFAAGAVAIGVTAMGAVAVGVKSYGAVTASTIAAVHRRGRHPAASSPPDLAPASGVPGCAGGRCARQGLFGQAIFLSFGSRLTGHIRGEELPAGCPTGRFGIRRSHITTGDEPHVPRGCGPGCW
jgi:hypothetical protein